ncbi:Rhodanese-like domain-containing protein [Spinellus fusiger]|nr:Rhodanese-like domain-containing protein [Spinellus fusiger]
MNRLFRHIFSVASLTGTGFPCQTTVPNTILGIKRQWSTVQLGSVYSAQRNHSTHVSLNRAVAFYSLVPLSVERTNTLKADITTQLHALGVAGRIYLAPAQGIGGINCQMSVPVQQLEAVKAYFDSIDEFTQAGPIAYSESLQDTPSPMFGKLRVVIKRNLVATKVSLETKDLQQLQPKHLSPSAWQEELVDKKENAVLIDMRNHYEYDLGHFDHAIKMDVDTFQEGMEALETFVQDKSKQQDIYMYCTGGIRCSVAGSYLQQKGYQVKMLEGGISAYGQYIQKHHQPSLFRGKNFTFDVRRGERITHDILAHCFLCNVPCDNLSNCSNHRCHLLFTQCETCRIKMNITCSIECKETLEGKRKWTEDYNYHRQIRPIHPTDCSVVGLV